MPKVSIVMPVFNAGKYLIKAIDSVLTQTFTDFELIIIDDGSTDNSSSIISSYADKRIRYYKNDFNLGIVRTLNKGIDLANGIYIARMDADDICFKDRILKQVNLLDEYREIGICGANCILIDENDKVIGQNICPSTPDEWQVELMFRTPVAHPLVMIRREILLEAGKYLSGSEPAEDYELWLRISSLCKGRNLQEPLLKYRLHNTNYSKIKRDKYILLLQDILSNYADYLLIDRRFIDCHIRFILGTWNTEIQQSDLILLREWRNNLIESNKRKKIYVIPVLRNIIDRYYSNALLSILKSSNNGWPVKRQAVLYLLFVNPFQTIRHIMRKI